MSVCCGGNNCSKKEQCKNYVNNYFEYHPNEIAQFLDWSTSGFGYYKDNNEPYHKWDCGDLSDDYPYFKKRLEKRNKMRIGTFSDYKGYLGTIKYDEENNMYYGSLININDLVNYQAYTIHDLYDEFKYAVDDYLDFKEEIKK